MANIFIMINNICMHAHACVYMHVHTCVGLPSPTHPTPQGRPPQITKNPISHEQIEKI